MDYDLQRELDEIKRQVTETHRILSTVEDTLRHTNERVERQGYDAVTKKDFEALAERLKDLLKQIPKA